MFSLKIFSRTAFQKYQDPNHHLINSTLHFPTHNLSNWQSQFLYTPKFHKNLKGKRPRAIFCHKLCCYVIAQHWSLWVAALVWPSDYTVPTDGLASPFVQRYFTLWTNEFCMNLNFDRIPLSHHVNWTLGLVT